MKWLWLSFGLVMVVSFAVLGWVGVRINSEMPPIASRVVTLDGAVVIDEGEIGAGQNVWQTMGGMEVGSIWGHGSYVAPDWSADWLHREAMFILDRWANAEFNADYEQIEKEYQAQLVGRLSKLMRTNTYDPESLTITIAPVRAEAFQANVEHYSEIFANGNSDYAIPANAVPDPDRLHKLAAFFFWTSWAASTNRPNDHITYTNNWPHEPLIGNRPTGSALSGLA